MYRKNSITGLNEADLIETILTEDQLRQIDLGWVNLSDLPQTGVDLTKVNIGEEE